MPILPHPREELFCQYRANGYSHIDAYRAAGGKLNGGPNTIPANPSLLDGQERIKKRIKELLSEKADKTVEEHVEITRSGLIARLRRTSNHAMSRGNISAAIAAEREIGILSGLRVEKVDQTTHSDVDDLDKSDVQRLLDYVPGQTPGGKLQ